MSDPDIYTCPTCGAICDVCGCPPEPPPERAILQDLIAELRELIRRTEDEDWPDEGITYVAAPFITTLINRAKTRLREVSDE